MPFARGIFRVRGLGRRNQPNPGAHPFDGDVLGHARLRPTPPAGGARGHFLERPLDLQTPGDRSRLFVVEQGGRIRLLRGRTVVPTPFLDITDRVSLGIEKGLLGLAFHPRFGGTGASS